MNLAINKLVLFLIMIIILLAILVFLRIPFSIGGELGLQDKLRLCCQTYLANRCPDDVGLIECPCKIECDESGICVNKCEGLLADYLDKMNWDTKKLKEFCLCPR